MTKMNTAALLACALWGVLAMPNAWAQAPAGDPSPSPSLDVTMKFIVDTANSPGNSGTDFDQRGYDLEHFETYGAASPSRCTLTWGFLAVDEGAYGFGANTVRRIFSIDLGKVDLSKVAVAMGGTGMATDYHVLLSAMPGLSLGTLVRTDFNRQWGQAWFARTMEWKSLGEAETTACAPKNKKCKVSDSNIAAADLFVNDHETANRLSQALLHAAALCGAQRSRPPQAPPPF